jgi:hypothetical protein
MEMCECFRREAGFVWNRMQTAKTMGIALSEETITETVLYNLAVASQNTDLHIDLATKHAESNHGADWEWWFVKGKRGICFRVQAKRLFPDGTYRSLFHGKAKYHQLDKLVAAAKMDGHAPLYCFYNFNYPALHPPPNACIHHYNRPSFWGCTLAFPERIRAIGSNSAAKLQPAMFPWHALVCRGNANRDLPDAANETLKQNGLPPITVEVVPPRVLRLIELGEKRRSGEDAATYLDEALFQDEKIVTGSRPMDERISGIATFRDMRT